jgi:hypothetical protein
VTRVVVVNDSMCNNTEKPTIYDPCPSLLVGDLCDDGLHLTSNDVCAMDQSCVGKVQLASVATLPLDIDDLVVPNDATEAVGSVATYSCEARCP